MLIDKNELEQLKVKLHSSEVIYQWDSVAYGERRSEIFRVFGAISAGIVPLWPFIFLQIFNLIVKSFGDLSALVWRAWLLPDIFLCPTPLLLQFNASGDLLYGSRSDPRCGLHFCAWFCLGGDCGLFVSLSRRWPVSVCRCGRFCLLAFGLTNFHPTVHKKEVYFADQLIVFDPIKEKMVDLNTDSTDEPWFDRRLFFSSLDEKTHFIELVKSIHNNVDYLPLQRVNDQYKHPIFNQELKEE